jgi:tetratricopeptide (TPR) repeat protein
MLPALRFLALAVASVLLAIAQVSPVQQRIDSAEKRVQSDPKSPQSYNDLAAALCRKARDTQDPALFEHAEAAVQHSLQLSPGNYDAEKLQAAILLGKHDWSHALKLASELNHKVPDDINGWALLVDANFALGNYADAERAAQWILDLRPGSPLGFAKAALIREHLGDVEGAIEFLEEAFRKTPSSDADERAWLLTQTGRLQISAGNCKRADELLSQALALFPDSHLALETLGKLRTARAAHSCTVGQPPQTAVEVTR